MDIKKLILAVVCAAFAAAVPAIGRAATVKRHEAASPSAAPMTVEQITSKVRPSVVSITVKDASGSPTKAGSGVIVGLNLVATCYHVIAGASTITVNFSDGRSVAAFGVLGANKAVDIAILGADTKQNAGPSFVFAKPNLGAQMVAIGNPEGLSGSVSTGIVSGIRSDAARTLIQTSAPISPGSSGGALLDMQGRLVGITSDFMSDGENLNFAISTLDVVGVEGGFTASFADLLSALAPAAAPAPAAPAAAAPQDTLKPLAGVAGVFVLVEDIDKDAAVDGLSGDDITSDVQAQLRKDSVSVDSEDLSAKNTAHGYLYVQPNMVKLDDGNYSYSINIQFNEYAVLQRATPVLASVVTWDTGVTGYVESDDMVSTIRQSVRDLTDKFSTELQTENGSG